MPVVTFDYNDFTKLLGKKIPKDELVNNLPMIGGDIDSVDKDEISIEFFPDRPDLLSVEGIVRAVRSFYKIKPEIKDYKVKTSDIKINVENSVKNVRPYVVTALVKNVDMSEELVSSLMELQEKLHLGLGRNRKKLAIGVHNFEPVEPPFTYKAVDPDSVQFVPLNKVESMTMSEILRKHEKGIDYAHLLKDFNKHPLIVDKNNNVLSYPPIINGSLTEVTPFTKDLFIDVTGTDEKVIRYALNIVTSALSERGGEIYSTEVVYSNKKSITPNFNPYKKKLSIKYTNKILGSEFKASEIKKALKRMGHTVKKMNNDAVEVEIPSYRADILHEIDLIEDVAIGYGYDNFETNLPKGLTFGKTLDDNNFKQVLRNTLIGLGFTEVTTFTISNKNDEFKKLGLKEKNIAEIKNPIGKEYSSLRVSILPSLLKILRENRHHSLPQKIFEIGKVVNKSYENENHLGFVEISAKSNFTECKSIVDGVLREIGKNYNIKNLDHPAFVKGRCASILYKAKKIGYFGELHPKTITNFTLDHPIVACVVNIDYF